MPAVSVQVLGVILAGGLSRRMGGGDKPLLRLGGRTLLDRVHERFAPQCGAGAILNANGDPGRFVGFPGPIVPDGVPGHPGPLAGILAALDHAASHHPGVTHVASVTGDAPFLPEDLVARLGAALGFPTFSASEMSPDVDGSRAVSVFPGKLSDSYLSGDGQRAFPPPSAGEGGPRVSEGRERGAPSPAPSLPSPDPLRGPPSPAEGRGKRAPFDDIARRMNVIAPGRGSPRSIAVASSGGRQHFTMALWSLPLRDDLRAALVERDERRVGAYLGRHGAVAVEWPAVPFDPFLNVNTPEDLEAAEKLLLSRGG